MWQRKSANLTTARNRERETQQEVHPSQEKHLLKAQTLNILQHTLLNHNTSKENEKLAHSSHYLKNVSPPKKMSSQNFIKLSQAYIVCGIGFHIFIASNLNMRECFSIDIAIPSTYTQTPFQLKLLKEIISTSQLSEWKIQNTDIILY